MSDLTPAETEALKIAGQMIDEGIPIFAAAPNPDRPGEYYLPKAWEKTVPSRVWLERWRPGWALAAVGGHAADFLDFDPRNGGDESRKELEIQGQMPRSFGTQRTPSGGVHEVVSPTGERKSTGFMPGVDLQSGDADGVGRGFVYIAPTVRPSKAPETLGELRQYAWETPPDLDYLKEFERGTDDTLDGILARVHAARGVRDAAPERESALSTSQLFGSPSTAEGRLFTRAEAEAFCAPALTALERAQVGEIEEHANRAAAMLSHFVPAFWDADFAYAVLGAALGKTAYDPTHPASGWDASKFRPVLDGRRPPLDDWKAELRMTMGEAPEPSSDAVDMLIAEMLTADQMQERPTPQYLIKGLLNLDSESWIIGEPGCKKSFVVLDQAIHVVKGMEWRGHKITQGPVVMIVAEGAGGTSTRIKAWQKEYGPIGEGLYMLPRPVQANDAGAWKTLAAACRKLGAVMVVVDTQARVTLGLKENDATDMGVYTHAVGVLREATGACVLTIHHTGRNGGDARGSSAIDGAQGTELKVTKDGPLAGKLVTEKQKDMIEGPDVPLSFKSVVVGVDEDGDEVTSLVLVAQNVFADAAGGQEPEPWEVHYGACQVHLIKALRDQGRTVGLTKAEAKGIIIERFHGGNSKALARQTFHTAWTTLVEKEAPDGEPYVTNVSGEKWALNPMIVESVLS